MLFGIAIVTGIRDENTLSALFMLSFTTMLCGLLTEMLARPNLQTDEWIPKSFVWRMTPHVVGFFPYITAWTILISNWIKQIEDICPRRRDLMPDWVEYIMYGCCAIFSLFTVVQCIYQWQPRPSRYWQTEVWYCVLSLTAKAFLGSFLLSNVIGRNRWQDALDSGESWAVDYDPSAACEYPPSSPPALPPQ